MNHHPEQSNPTTAISYNDVNDPIHMKIINNGANGSTETIRLNNTNDYTVNEITANDSIATATISNNDIDTGGINSNDLNNSNFSD